MTESSWVSLVEHVIWPVALLVMVLVLRRQIGDFLSAIGGRITQVSVMSVTIDLAVATETVPPWQGIGGEDVRGLVVAQQVNDSYFNTLRQSLQVPGKADFFVVDLKSDGREEWLTSRLYLFTYVLSRMKGVRSIVFTATRGDVARSFLGIAGTEELLRTLAAAEPWLHVARLQVEANRPSVPPIPGTPPLPPPPAALPAGPPNVAISMDMEEWWRGMRANPPQPDPLFISQQFLTLVQRVQLGGPRTRKATGSNFQMLPVRAERGNTRPGSKPPISPTECSATRSRRTVTCSRIAPGRLRKGCGSSRGHRVTS